MILRNFYVYILTNSGNRVLYVGMTNNLIYRVGQHKLGLGQSFTAKYRVSKLVYYEIADTAEVAIMREKQLKAGSRQKKLNLIESVNPGYIDLFDEIAAVALLPRNDGREGNEIAVLPVSRRIARNDEGDE